MYCPACGAQLLSESEFCHKCGRKSPHELLLTIDTRDRGVVVTRPRNEEELIAALERELPKLQRCSVCSAKDNLTYINFGLGMLKTGRRWKETFLSAAVSAVSLPLVGMGKLILPTKLSSIRVIPLFLAVCSKCISGEPDFTKHPCFSILWDYGFNKFIPTNELPKFLK